jgi:hypothetical protein
MTHCGLTGIASMARAHGAAQYSLCSKRSPGAFPPSTSDWPDEGQISKLLKRLEKLGLIENTGEGQAYGKSNAWGLTAKGEECSARSKPGRKTRGNKSCCAEGS